MLRINPDVHHISSYIIISTFIWITSYRDLLLSSLVHLLCVWANPVVVALTTETCRGRIRKSRASLLGFTRLVHVFHVFHSWWLRSYRIGKKRKHVKNMWKTCETCSGSWSRIPLVGSTRPNKSEANMKEMPFCPCFNFASISMRL